MARISEVKNFMDDGWEIIIKGKEQKELNKITELVNHLERECINEGMIKYPYYKKEPQIEMPMSPVKKPNSILIGVKGESMLDVARKVVDAVEFSVESPTGLSLISFDRERETKDRVKELIEYLKVYTNWR